MTTKAKLGSMFLLAAILVAGTISMTIPKSFAQGFNDNLGSDDFAVSFPNNHKKHGSDVNIQKVKCNNIIINGVEKSHPTSGDMTGNAMDAADENDGMGQLQSQGFANGERKFNGFDRNIVNVCINKNNIVAEEPVVDTCESCIEKTLTDTQISDINDALAKEAEGDDPITFQVRTNTPQPVASLDEVCEIINSAGGQVTATNIESFFERVNTELEQAQREPIPESVIDELILCLQDAELVAGGGRGGRD